MELSKFLSLCGAVIGFIAALVLSKILFSSAEDFIRSIYHNSPVGWPSVEILSNASAKKADTLISIILVTIAIFMQTASIFVSNDVYICKDWEKSIILFVILVAVLSFTVFQIGSGYKDSRELELKKEAAKDYLIDALVYMKRPSFNSIETIANQYFGLQKHKNEKNEDFVRRFAAFVGYNVPENHDFSKLQ